MTDADAESLISHLSRGLAAGDREAFRRARGNALATSPQCWVRARFYRVLVPLWRSFFHPQHDQYGGLLDSDAVDVTPSSQATSDSSST